ncbi:MAG: hypothetical protein M3X11_18955 [Acidobacteriota bacterium]|nr:hypothetical protein [Acidobacteriota bacterium]
MWKDFFQFVQTVLTVAKDLARTQEDVKEPKRNVLDLTLALQRLSDQVEMNRQKGRDDHEKTVLQLQIELLKFEKRLPPMNQ